MSGCQTCGGFGMHHDPIAHNAEPPEVAWRCICGAGDDGEWHSLMCVASNTPDDEWYGDRTDLSDAIIRTAHIVPPSADEVRIAVSDPFANDTDPDA